MKKILILTANPKNTDRLRLDEEVREIQAALDQSKNRDQFEIMTRWAVRVDDLQPILLDHPPHIVHFSGHGGGSQGLALENELGQMQLVSSTALAGLFKLLKGNVECVFLNACYSEAQAKAIHQHIPCVVGMNQAIGDRAAIKFAKGFYRAIGSNKTYKEAFELGCNLLDLQSIPESSTPMIHIKRRSPSSQSQRKPIQGDAATPVSASSRMSRVFISYRIQSPDQELAQEFFDALRTAGHEAFMAGESIRLGEAWPQRIDAELAQCDYFLLLLSERSVVSEMVTEEVRRAKQLRDQTGKPTLLPIRVNFPLNSPLSYDLRGYLQQIQQREWRNSQDTSVILSEVLALLESGEGSRKRASSASSTVEDLDPPEIVDTLTQQESLQMPPLPVAEPELPGGQVDLSSQFYVERGNIEARCYEAIMAPGALIRIKAPRQMGKTSLMSRILRHAEQQGYLGVPLSFQIADSVVFSDLDQFLRWFAASVGRRLRIPNRLNDYWDDVFGSKDNCTAYFEEYLLRELKQPLALCLDEVDMVFQHESIAADFFGLLRNWHENGKVSDLWKRFRLVVVHSTEVYIPMNINQSPFNVGLPIELPEFTADQVQDLAGRHGLKWNSAQIGRLMEMVGGHPYLVRLGLYHIARGDTTLEVLLQQAPTEAGLYGDHLRRHLWNLEQHPELAIAVRQLAATDGAVRLPSVQAFHLRSIGLVDLQGNDVMFRSELYRAYFRDRLGR